MQCIRQECFETSFHDYLCDVRRFQSILGFTTCFRCGDWREDCSSFVILFRLGGCLGLEKRRKGSIYWRMNSGDDQPYRPVKRGLIGKDNSGNNISSLQGEEDKERHHHHHHNNVNSPTCINLPVSSFDVKPSRLWRGYGEDWTPRGYILAVISFLSIFALTGSFMFAHSIGGSPAVESFRVGYPKNPDEFSSQVWRHRQPSSRPQSTVLTDGDEVGVVTMPLGCNERSATLRVFMYDLPAEFHYGMLLQTPYPEGQIWPLNVSVIPPYLGGLYQQHSPEYWLTSDLLTSNMADRQSECTAFRVTDWRAADVIFVPFFASLSYNKYTKTDHSKLVGKRQSKPELSMDGGDKNADMQVQLLKFLRGQPAWQESGGFDHVIVIHHPNSMHVMRDHLRNAMFVVADFGRYPEEVANIGKDIVAPYKHVIKSFVDDASTFNLRKTLLFFQGAIVRKEGGIIRQQLYELLKNEAGVRFEAGMSGSGGIRSATIGMQGSKFCLHLAGDTPSSNRLFDAIASHCVPVIISDDIELPYEDDVDYSEFCLFIKSSDALQKNFVINLLRSVGNEEWTRMWKRLQEVDHHFKYQHPTEPNDAVNMVWKTIARKVPSVKLLLHKQKRHQRSQSMLTHMKGT